MTEKNRTDELKTPPKRGDTGKTPPKPKSPPATTGKVFEIDDFSFDIEQVKQVLDQ